MYRGREWYSHTISLYSTNIVLYSHVCTCVLYCIFPCAYIVYYFVHSSLLLCVVSCSHLQSGKIPGVPDVAVFDFTSMYAAESAARIIQRRKKELLLVLVGDSLLEVRLSNGSHTR